MTDTIHRFVTVDGVRLHVAEAGAGEPVVLLHSFPGHWIAWRGVIPLLADRHRVICPDFRGAGSSDAPPTGYDTDTRVADLLGLFDALGLGTVRLVSHGWGAWTGFRLCLTAPDRVRDHLAVNMIHPWPDQRRLGAQAWRFWYTACWEYPLLGRTVLRRWPALTGSCSGTGRAAGTCCPGRPSPTTRSATADPRSRVPVRR